MPSVSRAHQQAMAIAEHNPAELYARNAGLRKMSHQQLHDFAATPRTGLPQRAQMARGGFVTVPKMRSGPYGQRGTGYATPPYHRELPQYMTENLAPQFSGGKNRLPQYQQGGVTPYGPYQESNQMFYPKTDDDFDKMPIGSKFIDPDDGGTYIKHSERNSTPTPTPRGILT